MPGCILCTPHFIYPWMMASSIKWHVSEAALGITRIEDCLLMLPTRLINGLIDWLIY